MNTLTLTGALDATRKIKNLVRVDLGENAGTPAAAKVALRDTDVNGAVHVQVGLAAGDSKHIVFDPPMRFPGGVYVQVLSGTVRGSISGT